MSKAALANFMRVEVPWFCCGPQVGGFGCGAVNDSQEHGWRTRSRKAFQLPIIVMIRNPLDWVVKKIFPGG